MNFRWPRFTSPLLFLGLAACCVTTGLAQTSQVSNFDPLQAFAGTWTATAPDETTPLLKLTFTERNGQLTGLTTHFKMGVIGKGQVIGTPVAAGESPLADLEIWPGDLTFKWSGDTRWPETRAKFSLQGTERAIMVFDMPAEIQQRMMRENRAQGFSPLIALSRETSTRVQPPVPPGARWEPAFVARLINTAEAQYRFKHGHYADYATLLHSGQLEETQGHEFKIMPGNFESATDPLPGYHFDFKLSPDAGYSVLLQNVTDRCELRVTTDQTGVVVESNGGKCPAQSK